MAQEIVAREVEAKRIGTIQTEEGECDLISCQVDSGRWTAEMVVPGQDTTVAIETPSRPTFGELKRDVAEKYAGEKFAFRRYQPSVDNSPTPAETPSPGSSAEGDQPATTGAPGATTGAPGATTGAPGADETKSEAQLIRDYLADHPDAANKDVVAVFAERGIEITSGQVSYARKSLQD
jgi:hypothetical protein